MTFKQLVRVYAVKRCGPFAAGIMCLNLLERHDLRNESGDYGAV
jgi:hypothetical protein